MQADATVTSEGSNQNTQPTRGARLLLLRGCAYLLDALLLSLLLFVCWQLQWNSPVAAALWKGCCLLGPVFYFFSFEAGEDAQTVGKQLFQLQVVSWSKSQATSQRLLQIFCRTLLRSGILYCAIRLSLYFYAYFGLEQFATTEFMAFGMLAAATTLWFACLSSLSTITGSQFFVHEWFSRTTVTYALKPPLWRIVMQLVMVSILLAFLCFQSLATPDERSPASEYCIKLAV